MFRRRLIVAPLALAASILACASPLAPPNTLEPPMTGVARTLQALAAVVPSATSSPVPLYTPTPPNLLPRPLYFMNKDNGGLRQIFRLDPDGRTLHQITFEPAAIDSFDVSPRDGSVAYSSNNQLFLVDASGAGRKLLLDGGPVDDNTRWTNSVGVPVWSPDGQTLAFSHGGLNLMTVATGASTRVLENQIDTSAGFPVVRELYAPAAFSPDGSKLLINIGFYEGGTYGIYLPSNNALVRFTRADGGTVCCHANWAPNGAGVYVSSPSLGMIESGLFYADAASGNVSTLLPGAPPDGTYNFADAPIVGPDGKLYFFFNNLPDIPASGHASLYLVRSAPDGVTGRQPLLPDPLQNVNEILWAPDASLAIVAATVASTATPEVNEGGQAQIIYPDGRPSVILAPFAEDMRWGP
jgi:sugar lactone lactonase YvrE